MATRAVGLPPGFELDPMPSSAPSGLPEGFVLDEGAPAGFGLTRDELTFRQMAKSAVVNTPRSGVDFLKNLVTPFLHPIQTGKAIGNLTAGGVELLLPGEQEHEEYARQMGRFMMNRYGSLDNFKNTIANDPVGVTADIASAATGIGAGLRGVGAAGKIATVSKIGEEIGAIGTRVEPLSIAKTVIVETGRELIPKTLPSRLYQSAAKFSTALTPSKRMELTNTALENRILPNVKGLDKLHENINALNTKITEMIDGATQSGETIQIKDLFREFDALKKDAALTGTPIDAQKAIENIRKQILKVNNKAGRQELTLAEAQKLKQNIYKETGTYYAKMTKTPAGIEAQQAVARAAKEMIEEVFPEIKQLNKSEGEFIELRDALQRSSNRITNRDLMGIGVPLKGTAGGVIGGSPGVITGLALGLFDTPAVKARLAITLNKLKQQGVRISPTSSFVKLGLFQVGRGSGGEY